MEFQKRLWEPFPTIAGIASGSIVPWFKNQFDPLAFLG
jgi:hypothetical protein